MTPVPFAFPSLNGSNGYYDTTALVGFTTEFDRASNKLYERHLHAENRSYLYNSLDSMNRLREYQRGTLSTGGATVASAITLPSTDAQRSYDLDGLGNWRRTSFTPVGGSATTEVRQHNPLNQITRVDSTHLAYDDNGNLTDDGTLLLEYDAFNRLKRVKNASNSQTVGEYTYDAMGRRVRKVITNGGITGTLSNGTTDYLYDQNQCVEERDGSNSHTRQCIWGVYIDELIQQKTYATTGGGSLAAGEYYPLQDLHYRVMALTDDAGDIVEAYDYDPYGKRQVFSNAGTDSTWFTDDDTTADDASCEYGHQGLSHDEESGLVYNRARMLHPVLGRFVQRDVLGYVDGLSLYCYLAGMPVTALDPMGLDYLETTDAQDIAIITQRLNLQYPTPAYGLGLRDAPFRSAADALQYVKEINAQIKAAMEASVIPPTTRKCTFETGGGWAARHWYGVRGYYRETGWSNLRRNDIYDLEGPGDAFSGMQYYFKGWTYLIHNEFVYEAAYVTRWTCKDTCPENTRSWTHEETKWVVDGLKYEVGIEHQGLIKRKRQNLPYPR